MNTIDSLFGSLPVSGTQVRPGAQAPAEAALPSLPDPADDSWADVEPPAEDWETEPPAEEAPPDLGAVAPTWEEHQTGVSALVARARANAARARDAGRREPAGGGATASGPGDAARPYGPGPLPGLTVADPTTLLADLNPAQAQAVTHAGSPLLIVAGAGSGKTRVLTRRIAHLIAMRRARPGEILAITFTNKAA
uniref:UvrD-helicase domain-containing protein n=1 Tax=uncultured Actinomyces sp. TaxID=249061 RepID=UPI002619D64B